MTAQYDQSNINLRDAAPITVQTPDGTAVDVVLDVLTADGQSLVVEGYGGGSDPNDVNTNHYVIIDATAIFTRDGGAGAVLPWLNTSGLGVAATLTFTVNDVAAGTQCILHIVPGGAIPYNHRIKISKIRF